MDRVDRTLIVTGISRSGTSLMTVLLNELPNTVCFNEVLPTDAGELSHSIGAMRRQLLCGEPVPNKYDAHGMLATDTLVGTVLSESRCISKDLDADVVIGAKRNLPYLNQIEVLLDAGYRTITMIREPEATIASWSSVRARQHRIPGALVGEADLHPHWAPVSFSRSDEFERRAEAWQHYACRIWQYRERMMVVRYEDLCDAPVRVLGEVARYIGVRPAERLTLEVRPARKGAPPGADNDAIRRAVEQYCPVRQRFGYA